MSRQKTVVAAALGECVHVAGVMKFLRLAEMDLAKMQACLQLIEPLAEDNSFRVYGQIRVGLLSHPLDPEAARGHLAAATYLQMALKPHIVHVVGHTEAHHAATADDVIAACKVARRAIENALAGAPDMLETARVQARAAELTAEARLALDAIRRLAPPEVQDPLIDPQTLSTAVTSGILDAPQLRNNRFGRGAVVTRIDRRGACVAVGPDGTEVLPEATRLAALHLPG